MRHETDHSDFIAPVFWRVLRRTQTSKERRNRCAYHLQHILNRLIKYSYNLYQQVNDHKRNSKKYKKDLVYFGLLKHGRINPNTSDDRIIRKRIKNIQTCLDYQNSLVLDALDLREKYLLYDFKKNKHSYDILLPKFELLFIKQQNKLNKLLSRDVEYGCALTMAGILDNWSESKWNKFNLYVSYQLNVLCNDHLNECISRALY